ncbi:MAG: SDR family oxidoreductase [Acidobacteriota bacterium]
MAQEGAAVSLCSRNREKVEAAANRIREETSGAAAGFAFDLACPDHPAAWLKASLERFGRADILVHNTGGPPPGEFDDLDDAAFQRAFELVVMSAVRTFRAVIPEMLRQGWGRIVAIESISVKEPIEGLLLSNALRPGVVAVCKSLARRLASRGIVVNCVAPGSYNTARSVQLAKDRANRAGISLEEFQAAAAKRFPRGRPGEPAELAGLVAFLCSEQASNLNGATFVADGGAARSLT